MRHPDAQDEAAAATVPGDESPTEAGTSESRPALADELARGAAIGRYTVLEKLGEGAMGVVYSAYDATLDRKIALKVLRFRSDEYESRLAREAQAMARLLHPNVVAVFEQGQVHDRTFLAMEFVQGTTLRAWRREAERPWREVLRAYVEAGRGLAAAHAAGLIHRDFKPDNVLVSRDGVVKVTDFGLARVVTEETTAQEERRVRRLAQKLASSRPPPRMPSPPRVDVPGPPASLREISLETPMTEHGALLGTPGYMAPEQYFCEPVDERTDQFAFAAALYEGLYGHKPFPGTFTDVAEATIAGRVATPPKGSAVPARILRVLLRAMSIDRERRYPSMAALLAELTRDPSQRRWRVAAAVVGLGSAVGLLLGAHRLSEARQGRLCSGASQEAAEVWNPDVQRRIQDALLATGLPYAAGTWARTRGQIDGYMARWTSLHTQTCVATRVDGHQSEQVMTARMACLEQRRQAVGALGRTLATADRGVVERAVPAAMALPDLDACSDVTALVGTEPEPTSPAARAELRAVREELAQVKASYDSGKNKPARSQVEPLVERARRLGYHPLTAEVLLSAAKVATDSGATLQAAIAQASQAVQEADVGRADRTRAEAITLLTGWETDAGRPDEAERWLWMADAAIRRSGDAAPDRAEWLSVASWLRDAKGSHTESDDYARRAFETARDAGVDPLRVAKFERDLAESEAELGRSAAASSFMADADQRLVAAVGEDHPLRIGSLVAASYVASVAGDHQRAFDFTRRAVELGERVAPDSTRLPTAYSNACWELYSLRDYPGAVPYCDKAVELNLRELGPDSTNLGYAYRDRADVLRGLGRYAEAIADYEKTLALHDRSATQRDPNYLYALSGEGRALLLAGRAGDALAPLQRAQGLSEHSDVQTREWLTGVADMRLALAQALWGTGQRTARVAELARDASDLYERAGHPDSAHDATAWLAAHR